MTAAIQPATTVDQTEGIGRAINRAARRRLAQDAPPPLLERPALKTSILLVWTYVTLGLLVLGSLPTAGVVLASLSLGAAMATCLTSVGHEAMHRPVFRTKRLDQAVVFALKAPLGISPAWWRAKHNITHHGGPDRGGRIGEGPVEVGPLARFAPGQTWHPWHRLQHVYVPLLLFPLQTLGMMAGCIAFCVTGRASGHQVATRGVAAAVGRLVVLAAPIALPVSIAVERHGWSATAAAALLAVGTAGTVISSILAVEVVHRGLATVKPEGGLDGWTRWQVGVAMTIDAPAWVRWFTGSVNQHVEHHLFPRAPMHRLAELGPVVQQECEARGVQYHRYRSYPDSWRAFHRFLVEMGRPPSAGCAEG